MQQKEEEEQPPCALDLLDVLLQLPLDVVNDNIYKPLVKGDRWAGRSAAGSTLHGVCCQSRTLADHLRTSCSMYSDAGTGPLEGKGLEAWHKDVGERAAYLCCLPRLTRLSLQHAHSDATLATLLTQYGHATQNRLRSLALHCDTFGAAAGSALAVAWPQLQSLSLVIEAALEDDAFLPLKDVSTLTSLLMHGHCAVSDNALRSLGKVTSLEEMEVTLELLPSNQLRHLASLTNLRDLVVDINDTLPCFAAASPLFALTRLTLLELPGVAPGAGHEPSPADDDVQLAQACAALGNLRELHSLDFSQGASRSAGAAGTRWRGGWGWRRGGWMSCMWPPSTRL